MNIVRLKDYAKATYAKETVLGSIKLARVKCYTTSKVRLLNNSVSNYRELRVVKEGTCPPIALVRGTKP